MNKSTLAIILGAAYDLYSALVAGHLPGGMGTAIGTAFKVIIDDFFPGTV